MPYAVQNLMSCNSKSRNKTLGPLLHDQLTPTPKIIALWLKIIALPTHTTSHNTPQGTCVPKYLSAPTCTSRLSPWKNGWWDCSEQGCTSITLEFRCSNIYKSYISSLEMGCSCMPLSAVAWFSPIMDPESWKGKLCTLQSDCNRLLATWVLQQHQVVHSKSNTIE